MREKLELLPVQRDYANLLLLDAASQKAFRDLVDQTRLRLIFDEIAHPRVVCGYVVGVDKDRLAAVRCGRLDAPVTNVRSAPFVHQPAHPTIQLWAR